MLKKLLFEYLAPFLLTLFLGQEHHTLPCAIVLAFAGIGGGLTFGGVLAGIDTTAMYFGLCLSGGSLFGSKHLTTGEQSGCGGSQQQGFEFFIFSSSLGENKNNL